MSEMTFADGLMVKAPSENAPDFVKCKLTIKKDEFVSWCNEQDGDWINFDVKEARSGKWYASVDTWAPEQKSEPAPEPEQPPVDDGDLPF